MTAARIMIHPPQSRHWNMAADEALLRQCAGPVLRCYRWAEPDAVSIGYFQPCADAGGRPFVRRYTGGGLVDHAGDVTYSIILPRAHPLAVSGTSRSYQVIHEAVARALQSLGVAARLAPADAAVNSRACFQKAVRYDVVGADARKLAGAAQRRTREGCLHQGSVRVRPADFTALSGALAGKLLPLLAAEAQESSLTAAEQALAVTLERERYATAAWNLAR